MENNPKVSLWLKYFLYLAVFFAIFSYLHDLTKETFTSNFIDTQHYYVNSRLLQQGHNIWIIQPQEYLDKAKVLMPKQSYTNYAAPLHSASFFLMFMPFTLFSFERASILWLIFCQLSFIIGVWLVVKKIVGLNTLETLSGLFLAFTFWPLREDFHIGQPNSLLFLFLALSLLAVKNKRIFLAGIFLGLGIQVKEVFLPMLLFCMPRKYWKMLLGAISVIIIFKAVTIFTFGLDKELSYWQHQLGFFTPQFSGGGYTDIYNISLIYLFRHLAQGVVGIKFIQGVVIILNLFILVMGFKVLIKSKDNFVLDKTLLEFVFFVTLCFMLNPWVHETHSVSLILALLISWFYILRHPKKADFILFIAAYLILGLKYAITSFPFLWKGPFAFILSFKGLGFVILFLLIYRLLKNKEPQLIK